MGIIKLNDNYYIKYISNINELPIDIVNIKNIKLNDILKRKNLTLKINFQEIDKFEYKKILKQLLLIKNIISKLKINCGKMEENKNVIAYIVNYDGKNKDYNDFILCLNAIFQNTRYNRYNYIYDTVCNYLDSYFYGKNLCDFKNNKCGEKRNTSSTTGCCHHFKHKFLGPLSKLVLCEYLNSENHTCDAQCISCKLFTCDYLEKKGIKFKIKDILLLDTFFNPLQKYFIKYMVFTPKEKIIKRLLIL